uniref:BFN domain-containing protein n=2 Tax=Araucaria cunninghamii TaxID=56994 RepID=A0A0D6R7E3_ARACU
MCTLQGPVICPTACVKQECVLAAHLKGNLNSNSNSLKNRFLGLAKQNYWARNFTGSSLKLSSRHMRLGVRCSSSMSSNNGSMAENFSENDEDYVNSSIVEAVEVKRGADGFSIIMRDGRQIKCVHNNPDGGQLPECAPTPAIVLKMEDGSDLLLPMIVLEMPSAMLMAAVRNVKVPRPTVYQILKDMIEKMGYEVNLVRVTRRVHEAYLAQLYLNKIGDETQRVSFDLRPSDAINIAVRCKVPIQVNKHLAFCDGVRIIGDNSKLSSRNSCSGMVKELDRPDGKPCFPTKEFDLVRNMTVAVDEERYVDAAQWRDELNQLRSQRRDQTKQV